VVGTLGDIRVAFLPRHGVGHKYLPHEIPVRANIHVEKGEMERESAEEWRGGKNRDREEKV
jgi:hypothetical protein